MIDSIPDSITLFTALILYLTTFVVMYLPIVLKGMGQSGYNRHNRVEEQEQSK